jgi:hypothetical protein
VPTLWAWLLRRTRSLSQHSASICDVPGLAFDTHAWLGWVTTRHGCLDQHVRVARCPCAAQTRWPSQHPARRVVLVNRAYAITATAAVTRWNQLAFTRMSAHDRILNASMNQLAGRVREAPADAAADRDRRWYRRPTAARVPAPVRAGCSQPAGGDHASAWPAAARIADARR